jgi:3-dehydroquinate synthase
MAILVIECIGPSKWAASLLAEDGHGLYGGPLELNACSVAMPRTREEVGKVVPELVAGARRAFEYSAVENISSALLTGAIANGRVSSEPITTFPTPAWLVPNWMAAAYAITDPASQFALIDMATPGMYSLLSRQADGTLKCLKQEQPVLADLLRVAASDVQLGDDLLREALCRDSGLGHLLQPPPPQTSLKNVLQNIAVARGEQVVEAALSRILEPLAKQLCGAAAFVDIPLIVCTGEPLGLDHIFERILLGLMSGGSSSPLPRVRWIVDRVERHTGAVKFHNTMRRTSGVWEARSSNTVSFNVAARREVKYTVIHPSCHVFDPEEMAIAKTVGNAPVLVAFDRVLDPLYGAGMRQYFEEKPGVNLIGFVDVDGSEQNKSWSQVERVCEAAVRHNLRRDGIMIAIGGGVTLDVVGMAAAIFRRGTRFVRIPTTLVGLVDVGVGVKQGVNFLGRKNILGAFYSAMGSINDPSFLQTLSRRDLVCGLAEIIKMAIVRDGELFTVLEKHGRELLDSSFQGPCDVSQEVMSRAEISMMRELQPNLYEENLQRLVDFGHTFSPEIEARSNFEIPHGEAVGFDMLISTHIAVHHDGKLCRPELLERMIALYDVIGLPIAQTCCSAEDLCRSLQKARAQRGGSLNLVVPTGTGSATFIQDVAFAQISRALGYFAHLQRERSEVNATIRSTLYPAERQATSRAQSA